MTAKAIVFIARDGRHLPVRTRRDDLFEALEFVGPGDSAEDMKLEFERNFEELQRLRTLKSKLIEADFRLYLRLE